MDRDGAGVKHNFDLISGGKCLGATPGIFADSMRFYHIT